MRRRAPDGDPISDSVDGPYIVREIISHGGGNGKFSAFIYSIFVATVLGWAGLTFWLVERDFTHSNEISVLQTKCINQPVMRGSRD